MKLSKAVLAIVVLAQCGILKAQTREESPRRPKVGLVLSGGGALGIAHVGVLKALEELRIPIDYIAGTSMGAVVGGLYASGMSPAELDDYFRNADWHFLLSDSLPREAESFRKKRRQFEMNQGIAFNVSRKAELKLPVALITGRNVMASLRELTVPMRHIRDFDRLPIPFRAVATDFEKGEPVVLSHGDLVESIRVSMSIPAVFKALRIDGRLLADGGMTNNLPISVVQTMGADVVIAVDVIPELQKEAVLDTASLVANQVATIFTQRQTRVEIARLGAGDVLLKVALEGMAPTDFVKAAQGIDAGYQEAMRRQAALARFAVGADEFRQYLREQRVPRPEAVEVSFLKVQTPEGEFEHALREPVEFDVKDQDRFIRLQSLIGDLGGMQKFEAADYEIISREGRTGLLVKAYPSRTGPINLSFGFRFGYSSTEEGDFGVLLGLRMTELNSLGGEWKTQLSLGDTTHVLTEWYQPVDWNRRFFIAAQGLFSSDFINGRDAAGDPLRFRLQDHIAGLDLGARLWQAGELRLGVARGFSRISRRLGVPDDVPSSVDRGWMHATLAIDTLDSSSFATRGTYGRVTLIASREELGALDNYTRVQGQFYQPITFGKNTFVPRVSGSVKIGSDDVPLYDQMPLGGFLNLSGLSRGVLFGQNAALAELIYFRKLGELPPGVGRGIYVGVSIEAGEVWADARDFDIGDVTAAGSVFLGADTFLGALYFGVGAADGGDAAVYLQLGPIFGQGREQR